MNEAPLAIEVRGLRKRFGETEAVAGLDLSVPTGCFYGLLGPNGAGKSTTIALLTGVLRPDAGTVALFGEPLDPDDPRFKRRMGVVSDEPPLFGRLRGREQLVFSGEMFGLRRAEAEARASDLLSLLRLEHAARTLVVDYSRGMRKKLAIGCALLHAPDLLFFDEPFEGVDAISSETIRRLLASLTGHGATVLLTTHILEVAEKLCERVGIIHAGRLQTERALAELKGEGSSLAELFAQAVGISGAAIDLPAWLTRERSR